MPPTSASHGSITLRGRRPVNPATAPSASVHVAGLDSRKADGWREEIA